MTSTGGVTQASRLNEPGAYPSDLTNTGENLILIKLPLLHALHYTYIKGAQHQLQTTDVNSRLNESTTIGVCYPGIIVLR